MNKIFKVIWNHATQTWQAVSELGRANGKCQSQKNNEIYECCVLCSAPHTVKLSHLLGTVIGGVVLSQNAFAVTDGAATGENAVAVGRGSAATGKNTIAIGSENTTNPAKATGENSIAIGDGANASVNNSIAIGNGSVVLENATKEINLTNVWIGGTPYSALSVDVGGEIVDTKDGYTYDRSFNSREGVYDTTFKFPYRNTTPVGAVSVGDAVNTRRITGVSDGLISATSTDVITGAQLYSVISKFVRSLGGFKLMTEDEDVLDKDGNIIDNGEKVAIGYYAPASTKKISHFNGNDQDSLNGIQIMPTLSLEDLLNDDHLGGHTYSSNYINFVAGQNVKIERVNSTIKISAVNNDTNTQATVTAADNTVTVTDGGTNSNGTNIFKVKGNYIAGSGITIKDNVISATSTLSTTKLSNQTDTGAIVVPVKRVIDEFGGVITTIDAGLVSASDVAYAINAAYWKLGENETLKDNVKAADRVNFINGSGSTANVSTNSDGTVNNVTFNVNVDNSTIKVNDEGKLFANVIDTNTQASVSVTPKKGLVLTTGSNTNNTANYNLDLNIDNDTITVNDEGKLVAKVKNISGSTIAAADKTVVVDSTLNGDTTAYTVKANYTGKNGIVVSGNEISANTTTLTHYANGSVRVPDNTPNTNLITAKNVADAINKSYFTLTTQNNDVNVADLTTAENKDFKVKPGEAITYVAGQNLAIHQDNGSITLSTKKDVTFNNVTANSTTTTNLTVKNGGTVSMGDNNVTNVANGTADKDAVNLSQLKANTTTVSAGKYLTVTSTLKGENGKEGKDYNVGINTVTLSPDTKDGKIATPSKDGLVTAANVSNAINAAYWKLGENETLKDNIKAADRVNFIDGSGTEAKVNTSPDGTVNNVTFNVNVDDKTIKVVNGKLVAQIDAAKVETGTLIEAKHEGENKGKVNVTKGDENKVASVKNVSDAINSAAWYATTSKADANDVNSQFFESKIHDTPLAVSAGNTLNYVAGKNMEVKLDEKEGKVVYATSKDLDAEQITAHHVIVGNQNQNAKDGIDGKVDVRGKTGAEVNLNGDKGTIGIKGENGKNAVTVKTADDRVGVNDTSEGNTRLVYTESEKTHSLATMDDGIQFTGNNEDRVIRQKLNQKVKVQGEGVNKAESAEFKSASGNINVKSNGSDTLEVQLNKNLSNINTITNGKTSVALSDKGETTIKGGNLNVDGNRIKNVKEGVEDTDAVNVKQLRDSTANIHNQFGDIYGKMGKINKEARGGIAGANAASGLPQVYIPGKSMVAAAAGNFKGENALAIGYSRSSDNGKVVFKLQGNANTQGDVGGSMGIGYQW